jgi:hypothetical protein
MAWPATVASNQNATAAQYNALVSALQLWGGQVDAGNNTIKNLGGFVLSANAVLDASAGGLALNGDLKINAGADGNALTLASAGGHSLTFFTGGSTPNAQLFTDTGQLTLRSADSTRSIRFAVTAGAEEYLTTGSGRLRFAVPVDVDTDVVAGGRVTAASLTVTNAANITLGSNWQSYTPVVSASGSMAVSGVAIQSAQWLRLGALLFVSVQVSFTLAGTADVNVYLTTPVAMLSAAAAAVSAMFLTLASGASGVGFGRFDATNGMLLKSPSGATWPLGNYNVIVSGFYRCA